MVNGIIAVAEWLFDDNPPPEPQKLSSVINAKLGISKKKARSIVDFVFGKIKVNEDIFGNDPRLFYDVILRKRNYYNSAFCCGAGSIHRREAVMSLALKEFSAGLKKRTLAIINNKLRIIILPNIHHKCTLNDNLYVLKIIHIVS